MKERRFYGLWIMTDEYTQFTVESPGRLIVAALYGHWMAHCTYEQENVRKHLLV